MVKLHRTAVVVYAGACRTVAAFLSASMNSIIFISRLHTGVKLLSLSVHKMKAILIEDVMRGAPLRVGYL